MKTIRKEGAFKVPKKIEQVILVDGTVIQGNEFLYYDSCPMKKAGFSGLFWTNNSYVVSCDKYRTMDIKSFTPAYEKKMADYNIYETTDKLYYGGLLIVFDKEYCRLAKDNSFRGEYFKNPKGLIVFKADENGSKNVTVEFSKRRGRFLADEAIIKMEAESGYISGFYKDWHWKIK